MLKMPDQIEYRLIGFSSDFHTADAEGIEFE